MNNSMKYLKKIISKSIFAIIAMLISTSVYAATEASSSDYKLDATSVLIACSVLLLFVIIALGNTLHSTILFYNERRKKKTKNQSTKLLGLILAVLCLSSVSAYAQDAEATATVTELSETEVTRWILYIVIGIELVIIFTFSKLIKFFAGADIEMQQVANDAPKSSFSIEAIWNKMNKFKSIEEEASIDTGHSYDGIRELNNVTPPWFIAGFVLSIIFATVYMWRYHVAKTAPLQIEEYNTSVTVAKEKLDAYLKTQANNVDENTVVMLSADGIASGQALFANNCVACHGNNAQGASVGPNLTDNYWIHKGSISDIFKSIKYGWPEKGMKSWKDDFSSLQIAQLASYIESLKGTNPAGAKEPQGELYEEVAAAKSTTTADSTTKM